MDQVTHLLDTHAVIWAYQDDKMLGRAARSVIKRAPARTLGITDFTLLELALLVQKKRLQLEMPLAEFLQRVERDYVVFPMRAEEAAISIELDLPQADPFDRVIVATALCRRLPLLTKDRQITATRLILVLW
jgi:PIN domain nuclease of toxin-antitoxin system